MASMPRWLLCLLCCFFEFIHLCNNRVEARRFSKFEDLESEKEVENFNKPSAKTVLFSTTLYNNIENSSDMYQSKMTSSSWEDKKSCPSDSIAIKITTKNDLIRAKLAAGIYAGELGGTHYAVVRTSGIFIGATLNASVWNPAVSGPQYSSAYMKLQSGQDSIEVGWMVNPSLYNDAKTRDYVYTKAGDNHCFNTYCGLYVPLQGYSIGNSYKRISEKGGPIYEIGFTIYRESSSGRWVLISGCTGEQMGFWPWGNFKDLGNSATVIEWGSKVFSPPNMRSPPMGSGEPNLVPGGPWGKSKLSIGGGESKISLGFSSKHNAYCGNLQVMNKHNEFVSVGDTVTYNDTTTYQVVDGGSKRTIGRVMFYTGAGGI